MSTTTPVKKPAAAGVGRVVASDSTSPSRRSSTPTSSTPSSVARSRSIRSGTPVSARAAAAGPRRESLLGSSNGADGEKEKLAREETAAALDDLKTRLAKAEGVADEYQKQAEVLQSRLDDTLREHAKLEERLHETEEQTEALSNEKREAARQMREMESIYEAERSSMMKEKDEMANREEEMQTVIQRLKDSLAAQKNNSEEDGRSSRQGMFTNATLLYTQRPTWCFITRTNQNGSLQQRTRLPSKAEALHHRPPCSAAIPEITPSFSCKRTS